MTESIKVLGQLMPDANVLTDVYLVPASATAVISTITVCNQTSSPSTFSVSVAVGGEADTGKQYVYRDVIVPANKSFVATLGITLRAADVLRFLANSSQMSINVFGVETT